MAATRLTPCELETVKLNLFSGADLQPLLEEQQAYWSKYLHWSFNSTKQLVIHNLNMRNLNGVVLTKAGRPIGYSFFIQEGCKALIGDLFLSAAYRDKSTERFLLKTILHWAAEHPGVQRIEGQLLTLSLSLQNESIHGRPLQIFRRLFMMTNGLDCPLKPYPTRSYLQFTPWADHYLDAAAHLIAHTYRNHVDSLINDQYHSYDGARRFLYNASHHSGCGTFHQPAALVAIYTPSREICGVCLASVVESQVGHVTQLCVAPHVAGQGLGYELLRRSLNAFRESGCEAVGLTVTESNNRATHLYESVGFRTIHRFQAFTWEAHEYLTAPDLYQKTN